MVDCTFYKSTIKSNCILLLCHVRVRSSRQELFCKKSVLRNFAKFTGECQCWSLFFKKETLAQEKIILFSLFTPQFFNQKFISILHVKWKGMNKGAAGRKLEVLRELTFLNDSKILFAVTKICIVIFNLTHSIMSLMGLF